MNTNIDKNAISLRILEELQAIAFNPETKPNHKLTAIRLLINFLSLDEKSEKETAGGVVTVEEKRERTQPERTQPENRRQRRQRERSERKQSERTQSERHENSPANFCAEGTYG
ncbi:MAG: hypothetical protein LBI36_02420 [Oscillospiraceae bacterium]|jgi:hypothetical protein|nr:hypothetical protein [Oscillospiraceae bacterium]